MAGTFTADSPILQNLKPLLGESGLAELAGYINMSPTMMAQLTLFAQNGVLQLAPPGFTGDGFTFTNNNSTPQITIDPSKIPGDILNPFGSTADVLQDQATEVLGLIAHELGHFVDPTSAGAMIVGSNIDLSDPYNQSLFADLSLNSEGEAALNQFNIQSEIYEASGGKVLTYFDVVGNVSSSALLDENIEKVIDNSALSTDAKVAYLEDQFSSAPTSVDGEDYGSYYWNKYPDGEKSSSPVVISSFVISSGSSAGDRETEIQAGGETYIVFRGPLTSGGTATNPSGAVIVSPAPQPAGSAGIVTVTGPGGSIEVPTSSPGAVSVGAISSAGLQATIPNGASDGGSATLTLKSESDGVHYVLQTSSGTVDLTNSEVYAFDKVGAVGGYIGGQLALLLAHHESSLAALATSTLFSTAGQLVGQEIDAQVLAGADLGTAIIANDFEQDAGGALGGFAGAEAGSALFKGVGLNPALGQILGGTIGAAVGVYAANALGKALGLTTASTSILNDVESSFAGAGIGIFEQITGLDPSKAFQDNPQNAEIGSSIGGLIGTALPIPVVGTVIGQFVGGIIGNLFGPGPSVGPNSSTPITVVNGTFALGPQGSDNNASQDLIATEAGFAQATVALLNAELTAVNGTVGGTTNLEFVRIFKDQFWDSTNSAAAGSNFPNPTARSFSDYSTALNDAVVRQLQMTIISGGDPALVQAMRNSFASYDVNYLTDVQYGNTTAINPSNPSVVLPPIETLQQLNYDLQAVEDYNSFFQNKVAFLIGFAARYSASADQQAATDKAAGNTAAAAADVANAPAAAAAAWNQEFFRGALLQRVWSFLSSSASESILDYSSTNTGHEGLLVLDASYSLANASISRSGNDLVISLSSSKAVTVTSAFTSNQYTLGEVEFTNLGGSAASTWNGADLQTLLLAGNGAIKLSAITLVNGSSLSKTISGTGTYTIVNGSSDTIVLSGQSGGIALNGASNKLTLSGSNNRISASGDKNVLSISGNSNTAVANGQGDTITLNGSAEMLTAGGDSVTLVNATSGTVNGISDTISMVDSDNLVVGGDSMTVTISGGSDTFKIGGNSETVTVTSSGSQDHIEADGQSDSLSVIGASNTITINGTGDALSVSGYGNTIAVNGASGNTITLSNYGNVVATAGTTITFEDSSGGTITGGGNIVTVGSSDNVELSGAGFDSNILGNYSTVDYDGGYGSATISGSSNTLTVEGDKNVVAVGGSGSTVTVAGLGERLSVSGTGQKIAVNGGTVNVAAGSQVTFVTGASGTYTNGSIIDLSSGATVVVNGEGNSNNWVQATSNDTITLNGTGDGVGGSGTGNKVTFSGTNQYGYISSATLTVTSGSQVNLSGSSNTVTVATGGTLSVTGDGNTITASGSGDSVSLGGSANHVTMTSGTLVLSGTDAPPGSGKVFSTDGFAFPSTYNGEYATAASQSSLQALAATGANSVEFVVTQYVESVSDVNISTTTTVPGSGDVLTTESDANLEKAIAQAQAAGISVLLKPHVDIADGTWRAYLAPGANVATFFANYKAFIVHYAQIAQQTHVGMLSIGSELQSLTGSQYLSYWTDIINAVRAVYSGKLTYGSAWSETSSVSFWNQLDVIGAHPYENPTQIENPTVAQLDAGWNSVSTDPTHAADFVDPISGKEVSPVTFYADLAAKYNKPVLFTEIGYRSVNGATLLDGNYAGYSYEDFQQQSNALEAFFQTFSKYSATWLQGAYLWDWDPDPTDVVTQDFSVQGKPAQNIVDSWYGPTVSATTQTANYLTGSSDNITLQDGHALILMGNSNTLAVGNGASAQIRGSSDTVTFVGSGASVTFSSGTGNAASGSNDAVVVGGGAVVTVGGTNDTVTVSSGGVLSGGTVLGGIATVLAGGSAAGVTVSSAGLEISSGGAASGEIAVGGGHVDVLSGGVGSSVTLAAGGTETIATGGTQTGTLTVTSGGSAIGKGGIVTGAIVVSAGGTVTSLSVSAGTVVLSAGIASALTISQGGANGVIVSSGGSLVGGRILTGTNANILAGGVAAGVTVSNAGLEVSSGGTAANPTIVSGGHLDVFAGGLETGGTVTSGTINLQGGIVKGIAVTQAGANGVLVSSGAVISGAQILTGTNVNVLTGGSAVAMTINNAGLEISSGGIASGGTVTNTGHLDVFAGGSASGVKVNGGTVTVTSGTVGGLTVSQGGSAGIVASAGGIVSGGTILGGTTANLLAGATAVGVLVNQGSLEVSAGATASTTTVTGLGHLDVLSGGTANVTVLAAGGTETVATGGVQTGQVYVSSGATLLGQGGLFTGNEAVYVGGTVANIAVSGATVAISGGLVSGLMISQGGINGVAVSSGGVLSGGTILAGTNANILSGGKAIGVVDNNAGLEVSAGGVASASQILGVGAHLDVYAGGTAVGATVSGSRVTVTSATIQGLTISQGGVNGVMVSAGGVMSGGTVLAGTNANALSGGEVLSAVINNAGLEVLSGGLVSGNILSAGGHLDISAGGVAVGNVILAGATETVASGGSATFTTVMSGGSALISGTGDTITLSGGTATVTGSGNTISAYGSGGIAVMSGGSLNLASGGIVTLNGNGNVVTVGSGATISALGSGNTIYATSASEVVFGGSAHGNVVYVSGQVAKSDDFVLGSGRDIEQMLTEASSANPSGDPSVITGLESAENSYEGLTQAPSEGAIWQSDTVTVSINQDGADALTPFEQHQVMEALDEWSRASGEHFVIQDGSAASDISITLGNLNTPTTGLLGQTAFQEDSGFLVSGVKVEIEKPDLSSFIGGSDGQLIYPGTDASFMQVALHEIGHAIGLADDADPQSIMYYGSGLQNQQMDITDLTNIATLYERHGALVPSLGSQSPPALSTEGVGTLGAQSHAAFAPALLPVTLLHPSS